MRKDNNYTFSYEQFKEATSIFFSGMICAIIGVWIYPVELLAQGLISVELAGLLVALWIIYRSNMQEEAES